MRAAVLLLLAIAGCAAEPHDPTPVVPMFELEGITLTCSDPDEKRLDYDPNLDFPVFGWCYWKCAAGVEQSEPGSLLLLLVDGALAPWLPAEPQLQVYQTDGCS